MATTQTPNEFQAALMSFLGQEDGVAAIEYGLLAALIAIAAIAGFTLTGTNLKTMYTDWTNAVLTVLGSVP